MISTRWSRLTWHKEQSAYMASPARFIIAPAGRRSGKSEIAKRKLTKRANQCKHQNGRFIYAAPTHDQAKEIAWYDIKELTKHLTTDVSEGDRFVQLKNGARIYVAGMDKPQRAEGSPLDGIVLDEFANMKPTVWSNHVRPALSTKGRLGWAIFPSVPEGRNHYFDLYEKACADIAERGDASSWRVFHWLSADILDPNEIAEARRDLDELTFRQEYEGSFVNYTGLAYYEFDRAMHAAERIEYNPRRPLAFCFDFNREPGIAIVCQVLDYHPLEPLYRPTVPRVVLAAIGEVHVPVGSNTAIVARRLIKDWGPEGRNHIGKVYIYGDASGGNQGSAKLDGSDWDIIWATFRNVPTWEMHDRVKSANPPERARVNAVNSALKRTKSGQLDARYILPGVLIDPKACPKLLEDFEKTTVVTGGSGELYKPTGKKWPYTHMTDAIGYLIEAEWPITKLETVVRHALV